MTKELYLHSLLNISENLFRHYFLSSHGRSFGDIRGGILF